MLSRLRNNKLLFFLFKAFILYTAWYLLYELVIKPNGKADSFIINNLVYCSEILLKALQFKVIPEPHIDTIRTIGIDGTHGIWIGDPCDGLFLFLLFSIFIISYPGPVKTKLWFIPAGIIAIHLLNVIRIVALAIIVKYIPSTLSFNHTYTFTILVYSFIFMLWMLWANRLSVKRNII